MQEGGGDDRSGSSEQVRAGALAQLVNRSRSVQAVGARDGAGTANEAATRERQAAVTVRMKEVRPEMCPPATAVIVSRLTHPCSQSSRRRPSQR
jgi:hypothetical protein